MFQSIKAARSCSVHFLLILNVRSVILAVWTVCTYIGHMHSQQFLSASKIFEKYKSKNQLNNVTLSAKSSLILP